MAPCFACRRPPTCTGEASVWGSARSSPALRSSFSSLRCRRRRRARRHHLRARASQRRRRPPARAVSSMRRMSASCGRHRPRRPADTDQRTHRRLPIRRRYVRVCGTIRPVPPAPAAGREAPMPYDLVIKNGTVIDGSGLPGFRADVGVRHGRIVSIGRIRQPGRETIDADGHVVAPGFGDGHTPMDAQIFWDPLGTSSCYHGITTVVMGNCGFTLAPCAAKDKHLVVRNLQRAEDIPPEAMEAGIDWRWTTFPEFLDTLAALPKGINYAGYIRHSALRTYVMGERAFETQPTEDELSAMERELRDALRAGAMGFTTSRSPSHETPDHRPVASRVADWSEVRRLVNVMGELNAGIFEIAGENVDRDADNPGLADYHRRLKALAVESGRPIAFGVFGRGGARHVWRKYMALLDETAAAGGRMFAQAHSRSLSALLSFKTQMPFDRLPLWKELRKLSVAEKIAKLRDPEFK